MKIKTNHISRHPEQIICPGCKEKILSEPISFHKDDSEDLIKEKIIYCWNCGKIVLLKYPKQLHLPINVSWYGEIKRVNKAVTDVITGPNFYQCDHIGVSITSDIFSRNPISDNGGFEVRIGVAILGDVNFGSSIDACPFDKNYHDNYCRGFGQTLDDAINDLIRDIQSTSKGLV